MGESKGVAYQNGNYLPVGEATIPILDPAFTKSDVVFDVVTVWDRSFFRLEDHLARFPRLVRVRPHDAAPLRRRDQAHPGAVRRARQLLGGDGLHVVHARTLRRRRRFRRSAHLRERVHGLFGPLLLGRAEGPHGDRRAPVDHRDAPCARCRHQPARQELQPHGPDPRPVRGLRRRGPTRPCCSPPAASSPRGPASTCGSSAAAKR